MKKEKIMDKKSLDKKESKKKPYVKPWIKVIKVDVESQIMVTSPKVRIGGDAGKPPYTIVPSTEDNEDTDLNFS